MTTSRYFVSLRTYALAFAVALSPAFMQSITCATGDTTLSQLEFEVDGVNQIEFTGALSYDVATTSDTAIVRAQSTDPAAEVSYQWWDPETFVEGDQVGVGGGEVTVSVPAGQSVLRVYVRAPGGAYANYSVYVNGPPCGNGSSCDDDNECTYDSCNPFGVPWCAHDRAPDGTTCDFAGLTGVCASGNCAEQTWGTAEEIGPGIGAGAAVDPDGNVIAVWSQYNGQYDAVSSRYTPGVGWGAPELIESDSRVNSVVVDSSGFATAVWCYTGSPSGLWSNRYTPGLGWGTSDFVDTDCAGASAVVDGQGEVTAVRSDLYSGLTSNRYTPGGGWGASELITATEGRTGTPRLTVGPSGQVTAVWSQSDSSHPSGYSIWSNRYTPGAGWGIAEQIETSAATAVIWGRGLASDPNGHVTAVWVQSDAVQESCLVWQAGERCHIWSNRYTPGVGWGNAVLVENSDATDERPAVAVDPNGEATAVWRRSDGLRDSIWSNRYTPGVGWGTTPERIEMNDRGDGSVPARSSPKVVAAPNGHVTAVWGQSDGVNDNVWSNQYTPGVGWGNAEPIESALGDAVLHDTVVDASGNVTAVWRQNGSLWSNRLESP